jgi:hypothetical protein
MSPEDAQDLTQAFFVRVFERAYLDGYDPAKARFRTFVRVCLDRFLANEETSASRLKRGGGIAFADLDVDRLDADLAQHARSDEPDPERRFYREWIRSLFADALARLRVHCQAAGHDHAFTLFERYDVDDSPEGRTSYAALARDSGISVAMVTNELAWARRAFRAIVLEILREVCVTDAEFRAEARDLLWIDPP